MATFADMLTYLRKSRGLSQQQFADAIGFTRSAVGMYETGRREPDFETLETIADFFNVNMDVLLGKPRPDMLPSNIIPMPEMRKVPLVGSIACGTPTLAQQNLDGEVDIPVEIRADFALRCKGDSMINARIYSGDIVYIRQQEEVEHGEIAAVLIGEEATLKRVYLFEDHISLEAENPQYRPMVYWGEDMNSVHILGKAVAFTSDVR